MTPLKLDTRKTFKTKMEIALIIPTKNEVEGLKQVLRELPKTVLGLRVLPIIIDGGSTDGTDKVVKDAGLELLRQHGRGKGAAMVEAAASTDAEVLAFVDADGTYPLRDLPGLAAPVIEGRADMVVGSRIVAKREPGSMSRLNLVGNRIFTGLANFAMKSHITDMLSGFRVLSHEAFNKLFLSTSGYEIEAEMTIEVLSRKMNILEVPLSKFNRRLGTTKLDPIGDGYGIFRVLLLVLLSTRPMLFFGIASVATFALGLYPASLALYEQVTTGNVTHLTPLIIASLLWELSAILFVFGVVAQILVVTRRRLEDLFERKSSIHN